MGAEVGVEVEVGSGPKQAHESHQRAMSVAATLPLPNGLRAVSRAGSLAVLVRRLVREHLAKVVLEAAVILVRQQRREQQKRELLGHLERLRRPRSRPRARARSPRLRTVRRRCRRNQQNLLKAAVEAAVQRSMNNSSTSCKRGPSCASKATDSRRGSSIIAVASRRVSPVAVASLPWPSSSPTSAAQCCCRRGSVLIMPCRVGSDLCAGR